MSDAGWNMLHMELNLWQEMVHCSISSLTDASSGVNSKGGRFNTDTFGELLYTVIAFIWFLQKP